MDTSNLDLKKFNDTCDHFLNGKYILAETKISDILKAISESDKIKNIIASCIENYNFSLAFKEAVGENGAIVLPDDAKGIISFCFSLLYNIDEHNINFFDFLNHYYGYNELAGLDSYKTFASSIILPFKEALNNVYMRTHILVETQDYQDNIYNRIKKVCEISYATIDNYKLKDINKEELTTILDAMVLACNRNDKETVYALLVALDYFTLYNKKAKPIFEQFKETFVV